MEANLPQVDPYSRQGYEPPIQTFVQLLENYFQPANLGHKDKNFSIERKDETKISKKKDLWKLHTYLQTLTREEKEELFALQHPVDKEEKVEESDSDF